MPEVSGGIFVVGVVLGGVVLFVIFNLLAMASQGDAYQSHLEETLVPPPDCSPLPGSPEGIDRADAPLMPR